MPIVDFSLDGKVALVTGGSKGIGRAIALAFAEQGADVAITARGVQALEATRKEVEATGRRCVAMLADAYSDGDLKRLHETVRSELGDVDILVNNVGGAEPCGLAHLTYEHFERILKTNTWAAIYLAQLCHPGMKAKGGGVVINISSNGGLKPDPYVGAYSASKAALNIVSGQMAQEWAQDGIRCTCICPGLVRTEMAAPLVEHFEKKGFPQNMLRMCAEPEHIAGMALLLASPAGAYCHGETYVVDGGEMWRATYTDEEADSVISEIEKPT
jgi:NAD(P)-dependent dehydrogenase (short-subunit alcohol dehydrogenase family)